MSRFPRDDYRTLSRYQPNRRPVEVDLSDNTNLWGAHPEALRAVRSLARGRSRASEAEPVKPVDDVHIDAIKRHVSPQIWAMVRLQRFSGMRPGE